jgi:hypothetical protein
LNQGHAGGYNFPSGPSPPSRGSSVARWLGAVPACRQCLSCELDVEAQPRPRTITQPHAPKALGVGVDPVASDAEFLGQLPSIDQANLRTRGRNELGDVLAHSLDLLDVERHEAPASRREQFDLPRDDESERWRR